MLDSAAYDEWQALWTSTSRYVVPIEPGTDEASGHWVHMQPWLFSDGRSLLRSSRLWNNFRKVGGEWKISRTRTQNVFVALLMPGWAESVGDTIAADAR